MKSPFAKDFWRMDNLRTTWEYKSIAFILRATVFLMVFAYLVFCVPSVWQWMTMEYVRRQPIAAFDSTVQNAIKNDDYNVLSAWLRYRSTQDRSKMRPTLEKHIDQLPALIVGSAAQIIIEDTKDEKAATFWHFYSRYRLRFDLIRCGQIDALEKIDVLQAYAAQFNPHAAAIEKVESNPTLMAASLQDVLDYDAEHPAQNSPLHSCKMLSLLTKKYPQAVPEEVWPTIRHTLRLSTESGIASIKGRTSSSKGSATPEAGQ